MKVMSGHARHAGIKGSAFKKKNNNHVLFFHSASYNQIMYFTSLGSLFFPPKPVVSYRFSTLQTAVGSTLSLF